MSPLDFENQIAQGEGQTIEFKRCSTVPSSDTFETICSFANRIGGSIYLGVENNGEVSGVNSQCLLEIERNIVNVTGNSNVFNPTPSLEFERIVYEDKTVIRVWVPMGPSVYRYKNVVYDRIADVDIKVLSDDQISSMYIRKKNYYSEQKIFPYMDLSDLRSDLIDRARTMATLNRRDHPWSKLNNEELVKAAGLYGFDRESGKSGYTLAAALLLGADDVIRSVCPGYVTDALVRIHDLDRYDDRLMVRTNLIDAYSVISEYCRNYMPDSFYLEEDRRVSVRDVLIRELISNLLIHREFLSGVPAQLIINADSVHTRNASRSIFNGRISLEDFSPRPKNPLIADFFTQIGLAEEMGSGTRNLYKYSLVYSGVEPNLVDGDIFHADLMLPVKTADASDIESLSAKDRIIAVFDKLLKETDFATASQIAEEAHMSLRSTQRHLRDLANEGQIEATGSTNNRVYRRK